MRALAEAPDDVAVVSADIFLPGGNGTGREAGGLPEVFVGCGVAIRREAFLDLGGYDPTFGYYAEEYDLSARLAMAGWRVRFDPRFRVVHHKVGDGRDMDLILERLVRNNGWVMQRYAPEDRLTTELDEITTRYRRIATRERAMAGYERGLAELAATINDQPRTPMSAQQFDRFTGLAHAREALAAAMNEQPFASAAIVDEGKNAWAVRQALRESGVRIVEEDDEPDVRVIGTMSPGPMLDAVERRGGGRGARVIAPWVWRGA
jgi:hypothetical protein